MTEGPALLRARAHPRAIAAAWAWQALLALIAVWPAASLVRASYGNDPRGDAALWEPGGMALMDVLWHGMSGVVAAGNGAALVLLAGAVAGIVPLCALMVAIARPRARHPAAHVALGTVRALPAFAQCAVVVLALQGATLGAGVFLGALAEGWTYGRLGEAPAQMIQIVVVLPFAAVALAEGVAHDVVRSVIVVRGTRLLPALDAGVRAYRASFAALSWSWGWRAAASLLPVGAAAWAAGRAGGGPLWLVAVAAAHQSAAAARVALRASWLARAMRAARQPAESER